MQAALISDFRYPHGKTVVSWQEEGRTFYRVTGLDIAAWYPNQCLYLSGESGVEAMVRQTEGDSAVIELVTDYRNPKHRVWGINALNREQNYDLNMLMDPEIDFVRPCALCPHMKKITLAKIRDSLERMQHAHAVTAVRVRHVRLLVKPHHAGVGVVTCRHLVPDFAEKRLAGGERLHVPFSGADS
mgnify:CR=1 FL=1